MSPHALSVKIFILHTEVSFMYEKYQKLRGMPSTCSAM
jgi:hypothetical protein